MSLKPAIASMSLGRAYAGHLLPFKLDQARANGLTGIEIFYEDLEYLARSECNLPMTFPPSPESPTPEALLHAASTIRKLCDERELTIIGLQPFMHYEGLLDREEHRQRIEKLKLWFKIAKVLKTDVIQIPANFLTRDQISGDLDLVVKDLQEVADIGLKQEPVIKFAYENLCWSTYFDTWEQGWEIVEKVDRDNFGLCLDTFNIAGRVYGDPTAADGKTKNAEADMKKSLEVMAKEIDLKKVFYIQVVDAEQMSEPLVDGHAFHVKGQPPRMNWSRNARLFYGEKGRGGYLPVLDVVKVIIDGLGYKGWVSMELFSRTLAETGEEVPKEHARRARVAWEKLEKEICELAEKSEVNRLDWELKPIIAL